MIGCDGLEKIYYNIVRNPYNIYSLLWEYEITDDDNLFLFITTNVIINDFVHIFDEIIKIEGTDFVNCFLYDAIKNSNSTKILKYCEDNKL